MSQFTFSAPTFGQMVDGHSVSPDAGLPDITALLPSDLVAHHLAVHGESSAIAGDFILADGTRLRGIVRRPSLPKAA